MAFPIVGVLAAIVPIIERLFPNPQVAAEAKLKMFELQLSGGLKELEANLSVALAQLDVNKEEAKAGPYRGGWRPFIGWTCGAAFAFNFVLLPISHAVAIYIEFVGTLPQPLDMATMMPVMLGMLGLGGMRSFEKSNGQP